MARIIIKEEDYNQDVIDWERTVIVKRWEHNHIEKKYIIDYEPIEESSDKTNLKK
jgi:hypothetical protein